MAKSVYLTIAAIVAVAVVRLASPRRPPSCQRTSGAAPISPRAVVVMGPSGCGKSTLARAFAAHCGWPFLEGDEHHPPQNVSKMAQGMALNEEDRQPFLASIGHAIQGAAQPVAVSCSALRRAHRDQLRQYASDLLFVWIDIPVEELKRRVRSRAGHFMPASLLDDQLATLEPPTWPERFVKIDGMMPSGDQLRAVLHHL